MNKKTNAEKIRELYLLLAETSGYQAKQNIVKEIKELEKL